MIYGNENSRNIRLRAKRQQYIDNYVGHRTDKRLLDLYDQIEDINIDIANKSTWGNHVATEKHRKKILGAVSKRKAIRHDIWSLASEINDLNETIGGMELWSERGITNFANKTATKQFDSIVARQKAVAAQMANVRQQIGAIDDNIENLSYWGTSNSASAKEAEYASRNVGSLLHYRIPLTHRLNALQAEWDEYDRQAIAIVDEELPDGKDFWKKNIAGYYKKRNKLQQRMDKMLTKLSSVTADIHKLESPDYWETDPTLRASGKLITPLIERREQLQQRIEKIKNSAMPSGKIAPFLAAEIGDVVGKDSVLAPTFSAIKKPYNAASPAENVTAAYNKISAKAINDSLEIGKDGNIHLFYESVARNVTQSMSSNRDAIRNIVNKGGRAVLWDLETLGPRIDKSGHPLGQRLTEFSFSLAQGDFKTGDFEIKKTYGSIIGFSEKEYKEGLNLIKRYQLGEELTDGEKVTLDRFARMGGKNTEVDWTTGNRTGIFRYKSFTDAKDATKDPEAMLKGLKEIRDIGIAQEKLAKPGEMRAWENELYNALELIVGKEKLTAVGHNTSGFDIKHLSLFANSPNVSDAFKKKLHGLIGDKALSFDYNFDSFQVLKSQIPDRQKFFSDYFGGDQEKLREWNRWMKKNDRGQFTQEAVLEAYRIRTSGAAVQHAAHVASEDAIGTGTLLYKTGFFDLSQTPLYDPNRGDSLISGGRIKDALELKRNSTQAFYAINSTFGATRNNIVTMNYDPLTGQWHTSDAVSVGNRGARSTYAFNGVRRRTLQTITDIGVLTKDNALYKTMTAAHPDMDMGSLMYIKMAGISNSKSDAAKGETVWVGTQEELMKRFNQDFIHAGDRDMTTGQWNMDHVSEENKKKLRHYVDLGNGFMKPVDASFKDLVDDSTFAFDNDAPARVAREMNARKDKNILRYIDEMDAYVENNLSSTMVSGMSQEEATEKLREEFRQKVHDKSRVSMQKYYKDGISLSKDEITGTYFDYFGWQNSAGEHEVYTSTSWNARQLENFVRRNRGVIDIAMEEATRRTNGAEVSSALFQAYYRQARENIEDVALAKSAGGVTKGYLQDKSALGYVYRPRIAAEMDNIFEVDLDGFRGIDAPEGRLAKISLSGSGYGMADEILRGMYGRKIEDVDEQKKVALLKDFRDFLVSNGTVSKELLPDIIETEETSDVAASKIMAGLRKKKETNFAAGVLSPLTQMDITQSTIKNHGLTEEEIRAAAVKGGEINILGDFYQSTKDKNGVVRQYISEEQKKALRDIAKDINDNILFNPEIYEKSIPHDEAGFVEELEKVGYSKADAKIQYKIFLVKKQSSEDFLTQILEGVYANGGHVGYNKAEGKVYMFNNAADKDPHELHFSRQVFENGAFYSRNGKNGQRLVDQAGIFVGKDGKFHITNQLGIASKDLKNVLKKRLFNAREAGDLAEGVNSIIAMMDARQRKFSAAIDADKADRRMANGFYYGDAIKGLDQIGKTKVMLNFIPEEGNRVEEVFKELLSRGYNKENAKALSELLPGEAEAIVQNGHLLFEALEELVETPEEKELIRLIKGQAGRIIHNGDKGIINPLSDTTGELENFHSAQTDMAGKIGRGAYFVYDDESEKNLGKYLKHSYYDDYGATEESKYATAAYAEEVERTVGKNKKVASGLVANSVTITSRDWRRLWAAARENEDFAIKYGGTIKLGGAIDNLLGALITDEGAGMVTSYAADYAMNHEFYEQIIDLNKLDAGHENKKLLDNIFATSPKISIEDGKIQYTSTNGRFVSTGDTILHEANDLGIDSSIKAKQDGFLRMSYFSDRTRVSDERITEILNIKENAERILNAEDQQLEAHKILREKGFSSKLYVDALDISGQIKLAEMNEKSVGRVSIIGLGAGDHENSQKIRSFLEDVKATNLIGHEVTADVIDEMLQISDESKSRKRLKDTKLAMAIEAGRQALGETKRLSEQELQDAIKKHFGGTKEFHEAMFAERHSATEALQSVFRWIGADKANEGFAFIGNNLPGQAKHGDAPETALQKFRLALLEGKGKDGVKYSNEAINKILDPIFFRDSKGNEDKKRIDLDAYKKISKEYLGHEGDISFDDDDAHRFMYKIGEKGKYGLEHEIQFEFSKSKFVQLENFDRPKINDEIRVDERVISNLRSHRYSQNFLDRASNGLFSDVLAFAIVGNNSNLDAAADEIKKREELGKSIYETYFKDRKAGELLDQSLSDRIVEERYATHGENRLFDTFKDLGDEELNAAYEDLEKIGISREQIDPILEHLKGKGITSVTSDKAANLFAALSFENAKAFNAGNGSSLEQMQKMGFKVMTMDELDASARAAKKSGAVNSYENALAGQQVIIDLDFHDSKLSGRFNESERYLAIPFTEIGQKSRDGSFVQSDMARSVKYLQEDFQELRNNYYSMSEDNRGKLIDRIKERISDIKTTEAQEATAKNSMLKQASTTKFTDGTIYATAQGHEFHGREILRDSEGNVLYDKEGNARLGKSLDAGFEKMHFLGINLSEQATQRELAKVGAIGKNQYLEIGYAILGNLAKEKWYNDDYFNELAGGNAEEAKKLKKATLGYLDEGGATLTDVMRHPTQQHRSIGATATYFNNAVGNDQITIAIRQMLQMKGDFDSDHLSDMMVKSKAVIDWGDGNKINTTLDYATYLNIKDRANVKLLDNSFADAISSIFYASSEINKNVDPRDTTWKRDSFSMESVRDKNNGTYDGVHTVDKSRNYSYEQIRQGRQDWNQLKNEYASYLQHSTPDGLGEEFLKREKDETAKYLQDLKNYAVNHGRDADAVDEIMHLHKWDKDRQSLNSSNMSKGYAGQLNDVLYKWQRISDYAVQQGILDANESDLMRTTISAIQEATLTGKSEHGGPDIDRVKALLDVDKKVYSAMRTGRGLEEAANEMMEVYGGAIMERANKEFDRGPEFWKDVESSGTGQWVQKDWSNLEKGIKLSDARNKQSAENAVQLMGKIARNVDLRGFNTDSLKTGVSKQGMKLDQQTAGVAGAQNSPLNSTMEDINSLQEAMGGESTIHMSEMPEQTRHRIPGEDVAALENNAEKYRAAQHAAEEAALESASGVGKRFAGMTRGHGIIAGAIGIAAGLLTSGYASGPMKSSPTPATSQSSSMSQDEQVVTKMNQVPSLSDANMNVMRGGPKAGYVININASSPQGQAAAVKAINNAASGMTPQNGSINVSMSTDSSDSLSQLQVNRMVANALGVA